MIASHSGAVPPTHCDADTLARNVYPLAYWASLLSLPALAKRALLYALQACSIPRQAVGMELGNLRELPLKACFPLIVVLIMLSTRPDLTIPDARYSPSCKMLRTSDSA